MIRSRDTIKRSQEQREEPRNKSSREGEARRLEHHFSIDNSLYISYTVILAPLGDYPGLDLCR